MGNEKARYTYRSTTRKPEYIPLRILPNSHGECSWTHLKLQLQQSPTHHRSHTEYEGGCEPPHTYCCSIQSAPQNWPQLLSARRIRPLLLTQTLLPGTWITHSGCKNTRNLNTTAWHTRFTSNLCAGTSCFALPSVKGTPLPSPAWDGRPGDHLRRDGEEAVGSDPRRAAASRYQGPARAARRRLAQ